MDLVVLGEITLDVLDDTYCRPGGAAYSALAGAALGARTGILGHIGPQGERWVKGLLAARNVNHAQLYRKPGHTTVFRLVNSNEIESIYSERRESEIPTDIKFLPVATRALLIYPYPASLIERAIDACSGAIIAYDLQYDLHDPDLIRAVIQRCSIVFASRQQAMEFFGTATVEDLSRQILSMGPEIVVVKSGLCGSTIYSKRSPDPIPIPRFKVAWQQSVGAGDVYNAAFLTTWLDTGDLKTAGIRASAASAMFCEDFGTCLLTDWDLKPYYEEKESVYVHPDDVRKRHVYLAAPFFDISQRALLFRVKDMLEYHGFQVFSPFHKDGIIDLTDVVQRVTTYQNNLEAIEQSLAVVALLDGSDPGTLWECGYAYGKGVPVVSLWTGPRFALNLMPAMGGTVVQSLEQLIEALLEVAQGRRDT